MFRKDEHHVYRAEPLDRLGWVEHGFGTRHSATPADAITLRQLHSSVIHSADGRAGCIGEGDGLITREPGRILAIRTADCLPMLLVDEKTRAVAAVHAGWRGVVLNIAAEAISRFGDPSGLHAVVGPGIGACCFEVGPEVATRFRALFPERDDLDRSTKIDLAEALRRQFAAAGVARARIYVAGLCTRCRGDEFHSWRRDGEQAGRMHSWVSRRQ